MNIVQQLSSNQSKQQIKLTVSSTVHSGPLGGPVSQPEVASHPPSGPSHLQGHSSSQVHTSSANICKQEPADDSQCTNPSSQSGLPENIGLADIEELQAILDTLEKEEGEIPPDIIRAIDSIEACDGSTGSPATDSEDHNLPSKSPMFNSGGGNKGSTAPGMYADPPGVYDSGGAGNPNMTMGGQGAAAVNYQRPQSAGAAAPPMLGDTGPAAETLKQMAAQHQTHGEIAYPMKSYPAPEMVDGYQAVRGRMPPSGYHGYPGQQNFSPQMHGAQNNMYPQYNQQTAPNNMNSLPPRSERPPHMMSPGGMPGKPDMNYGQTKPLTHFPEPVANAPSSLQQLQNQVQSHFTSQPSQQPGQPGQMHITQSQNMHVTTHGAQRMHLSQTQQMQIQAGSPHQISMAQQQSFSMSHGAMGPNPTQQQQQQQQYEQQMRMRMYQEKMRAEQQQHGGPQGPQMQQYMNRPPPEYTKMPPGNMNGNYPPTSMAHGVNPLQTMQNMVNQTSQPIPHGAVPPGGIPQNSGPQNGMYGTGGPIKTEAPHIDPQGMRAPMRQGSRESPMPGPQNYPTGLQSQPRPPMMNPQQVASQNGPNSIARNRPMKSGTPSYNSTIMRGTRAPNVNVGPEGLNISQQRPHSAEWPRPMGPNGTSAGGPPMHQPQMPNNSMMHYGSYQGQSAMMSGPGVAARMQMIPQQMHPQQPGPHMAPNMPHPNMASAAQQRTQSGMMISQQQSMHMAQQQQQQQQPQQQQPSHSMPNMNMSQMSSAPSTPQQQVPPAQSGQNNAAYPAAATNGNSDFPLDFLDNAQGNNGDFFESMLHNPNQPDIFDEIFGPGK